MDANRTGERVAALAIAGVVAFHQPLISVFDQGAKSMVGGIPVLYVYLFVAWALLIGTLAFVLERSGPIEEIEAEDESAAPDRQEA